MSANNEYKRYFIILQEDDKGYEISPGKIPTGYVKIEVKNGKVKLNAFIQNVKAENIPEYRLILIASGKNAAVDVGKIIIDGSGRGELYYELESDNVLKTGMNISEFGIAAVASGASIPLSGYAGREKVEWKGKYEIVNRTKAAEAPRMDKKIQIEEIVPPPKKEAEPPKMEPAPLPKEKPANIPSPPKAPEPTNIPNPPKMQEPANIPSPPKAPEPMNIPNPPKMQEPVNIPNPPKAPEPANIQEPIKTPEPVNKPMPPKAEPAEENPHMMCPPIVPMEEPEEVECPPAAPVKQTDEYQYYYYEDDENDKDDYYEHKHYTGKKKSSCKKYPYFESTMYSRMKRMIRRLRRYEPFEEEEDYEWFKVGVDDIYDINSVAIPYMGYMVPMGYPFMLEGYGMMMMDRKDFILGVRYIEDEEDDGNRIIGKLMFGIPWVYSRRSEAYYKSRGFMSFKPHKSGSYGYFIMCIDLRSGMFCRLS